MNKIKKLVTNENDARLLEGNNALSDSRPSIYISLLGQKTVKIGHERDFQ